MSIESYFKKRQQIVLYIYHFNGWKPLPIDTYEEFERYIKKHGYVFNEQLHDLTFFGGDSFHYYDSVGHTILFRITHYPFDVIKQREFIIEHEMCYGWDLTTHNYKNTDDFEKWMNENGSFIKIISENFIYYAHTFINKKNEKQVRMFRANYYLK